MAEDVRATVPIGDVRAAEETDDAKRARSEIRFPYGDLEDAVEVATVVFNRHGSGCSLEELAPDLDTTVTSSSFRTKMATARTFGVIESGRGRAELTQLGRRIADPTTADSARAEAFLQVPLYREVYDLYSGKLLPGDRGLESEMVRLGVAEKTASRARQVLQRSAQQAGFFTRGTNRLVRPVTAPPDEQERDDGGATDPEGGGHGEGEPESMKPSDLPAALSDPLIKGIWTKLPTPGETFTPEDQKEWLDLMKLGLQMVYGRDPKPAAGDRRAQSDHGDNSNGSQ